MPDNDDDADFWAKMERIVAGKLDEHDQTVTSKRYNKLIEKVGENSAGLDKVKNDVSILRSSVKRVEEIKSFNDAKETSSMLASIQEHLGKIDKELSKMKSENSQFRKKVLVGLNVREQRDHNWSIRIKNWQSPLTPEKITENLIYKQLIYPVLEIAYKNGDIDFLGDRMSSHIEQCHFLKQRDGSIPVCIFRFYSRRDLYAFMTLKRTTLEMLNARINNCKDGHNISGYPLFKDRRIKVQHSLSHLNKNLETFVHSSGAIKRTKIAGTTLCVMRKGTNGPWRRIENPFGRSFAEMFRPLDMADPESLSERSPLEAFIALAPKDRNQFFEGNKQFHVREADFGLSNTGVVDAENITASALNTTDFPAISPAPAEGSQEPAAAASGDDINQPGARTRGTQRRAATTAVDSGTIVVDIDINNTDSQAVEANSSTDPASSSAPAGSITTGTGSNEGTAGGAATDGKKVGRPPKVPAKVTKPK